MRFLFSSFVAGLCFRSLTHSRLLVVKDKVDIAEKAIHVAVAEPIQILKQHQLGIF